MKKPATLAEIAARYNAYDYTADTLARFRSEVSAFDDAEIADYIDACEYWDAPGCYESICALADRHGIAPGLYEEPEELYNRVRAAVEIPGYKSLYELEKPRVFNYEGNECELYEVSAINPETGERESALLLHEMKDEHHDGDQIYFCSMPEDDEDFEIMIFNEYGYSESETIATIKQ